jgi:hypothetical protein
VTRRRAALASAGVLAAAALVAPPAALAHGLAGRGDLPIPQWLFAWAAAVVLVVSFVGLAVLWPTPRLQGIPVAIRRLDVPAYKVWEALAGAIGLGLFVLVVYAGFAGVQTTTANFAPTWIFVIFWVGGPVFSVLLGDVFRAFNPWRALARGVAGIAGLLSGGKLPEPMPYPAKLGRWPAVVTIMGFAWLELVYVNRDDPSILAALSLGYAAVPLVGMSLYGIEAWSTRADGFGVAFELYSRLSPVHWEQGRVTWRRPLSGAPSLVPAAGTAALLCTMIGTTSFDGFSAGPTWLTGIQPHLLSFFGSLGFGDEGAQEVAGTLGLFAMVLIIYGLYRLGIAGMQSVGGNHKAADLAMSFAHSLIPISFAYVAAHYCSLLVNNGQAIIYLASDPLGHGSNLFGTADRSVDYFFSAKAVWYVQVACLVIGHAAGLALAHDRALATWRKARDATRSQYWMLAVMVGFTSLGLWLLSAQGS